MKTSSPCVLSPVVGLVMIGRSRSIEVEVGVALQVEEGETRSIVSSVIVRCDPKAPQTPQTRPKPKRKRSQNPTPKNENPPPKDEVKVKKVAPGTFSHSDLNDLHYSVVEPPPSPYPPGCFFLSVDETTNDEDANWVCRGR